MKSKTRIMNFRPIFFCFIFLWLGIIFSRNVFAGDWKYISFACIGLIAGVYLLIKFRIVKQFLVCLISFIIGLSALPIVNLTYFRHDYGPESHTIVGRVSNNGDYIILKDVTVDGEKANNLCVYGHYFAEIGDCVIFESQLTPIKLFTLGRFSSYNYREGVTHSAYITNGYTLENNKSLAEDMRESIRQKLNSYMSSEQASMAYAMLFGDKTNVDEKTSDAYKISGIAHILAVSGLHIGFFCAIVSYILEKLKVKAIINFFIMLIFLFIYCYLCSFTPSVVRASLMFMTLLSSTLLGKKYDGLCSISFAGTLILLIKPLYAFDLGFQLSFLCVISIFVLYSTFYDFLKKIKIPALIASPLAVTLCTQIGLFPVCVNMFGYLSTYSIVTNLVCIPVFQVAFTTLVLFLPIVMLIPPLSFLLFISGWLTAFVTFVAKLITRLPLATIDITGSHIATTLCYFVLIIALSRLIFMSKKSKAIVAGVIAVVTVMVGVVYSSPSLAYSSFYSVSNSNSKSYILTTSRGEIVAICYDSEANLLRYLNTQSVSYVDYLLYNESKTEILDKIKYKNAYAINDEISVTDSRLALCSIITDGNVCGMLLDVEGVKFAFIPKQLDEWELVDFELQNISCDFLVSEFNTEIEGVKKISYEQGEQIISQKMLGNFTFSFKDDTIETRSID